MFLEKVLFNKESHTQIHKLGLQSHLVSLPFEVEDALYTTLFPEAIEGTLYSYNGSYVSESGLISGKGYWLRFPNAGDNMITGTLITELTLFLSAGWNLISGTSEVSTIIDPSGIIIQGTLFGYNGAYYNAIELEPGEAYWVRANADGEISIISTGNTTPVSESSKLK